MKKIFICVIVLFFFVACEQPANECDCSDPEGRSLIDSKSMYDMFISFGNAMADKNIDELLDGLTDDVVWYFPNKQKVSGKEQLRSLMSTLFDSWEVMQVNSGWTDEQKELDQDQPIYLGVKSSDGVNYLLVWTMYYFKAKNGVEISLPWHIVYGFNEEGKINYVATYYDRSELTSAYDGSDPIK